MENLRGAALMVLAMLGFAIEDMFIKLLAARLPTWQIIACLGIGAGGFFAVLLRARGEALFPRAAVSPLVLLRNLGELIGTLCFVTALALTPLAQASAILQALPLSVTLGAALFLGEAVGWRRWAAIAVGFVGVLLVIQPGLAGFDANALFAVAAVVGLTLRDLVTRRIPRTMSSFQLSFLAFLTLIPAVGLLALTTGGAGVMPLPRDWALLAGAVVMGILAYSCIVGAVRLGEVSFVTPFRYSRILFALVLGAVVFGERPDALMVTGAALIVGSGLFTLWRERKHRPTA
ncbi:MAG: DMT family transporter [Proteobacteria bacterium]|nr:DMT family transporter [Pseudomonadota bacterium]